MNDARLAEQVNNMSEQTWIDPRCDRKEWPAGPWDGEPDKVQWKDESTGIVCLAKRNYRYGNWCGYVGVQEGHPWHGKDYDDINVNVHGGLTFAESCQEGPPETTICHIPSPGEPEHLWWLGFDCAHAWDRSPRDEVYARDRGDPFTAFHGETYKALGYVRAECARLASQVKECRSDD